MKIAARVPMYPPASRVGSWLATHLCLAHMVQRGHQVDVVTYLQEGFAYVLDGVAVHPRARWGEIAEGCDVVVSHLGDDQAASQWAKAADVPSVRMVHGEPRPGHVLDDTLAVFNSQSLRHHVGHAGPSVVVHPPIDPAEYRTTPGRLVTLVNLAHAKGGLQFFRLAKSTPDVQFLGVRGGYGAQVCDKAKNVTVIDPTLDMVGDVYARTRVLLMPSSHESWGMVAVEAMASGIPVIAHPTPGLLESLGGAGIFVDRDDLQGWQREVRRLMSASSWAEASARASERAAELDPAPSLARFSKAVEALAAAEVAA